MDNFPDLVRVIDINRNFTGQKGSARNIQSDEKQGPANKITLPNKTII